MVAYLNVDDTNRTSIAFVGCHCSSVGEMKQCFIQFGKRQTNQSHVEEFCIERGNHYDVDVISMYLWFITHKLYQMICIKFT